MVNGDLMGIQMDFMVILMILFLWFYNQEKWSDDEESTVDGRFIMGTCSSWDGTWQLEIHM